MSGWLIEVPVKRFGMEPLVHLYAVWLADEADALAAVEKGIDLPNERPELLIQLSNAALLGLGLARGEVCRVHSQR